jgi:hypothetical protein
MAYKIVKIPKKDGSIRILHVPDEELKNKQREILFKKLSIIKYPELKQVSILGQHNCKPYGLLEEVNELLKNELDVFLTEIDIKDFFHSVTPDYLLFLLPAFKKDFENIIETCFVEYKGKLVLPQGAPTSPRLSSFAIFKLLKQIDKFIWKKPAYVINYIDNFYMFHAIESLKYNLLSLIQNYYFKISKFKCRRIPFRAEHKPFVKMLGFTLCREDDGTIKANVRQKTKHTIRGLKNSLKYGKPVDKILLGYESWENIIKQINTEV